ncbi:MAG: glycosyltransferase family 2 protein [Bdellovibrionota bacterium]
MKVSGFTIIKNGNIFDYPYQESLHSMLPLVDELIVNIGRSDDDTAMQILSLAEKDGSGKIRCFETSWEAKSPEQNRGGALLAEQTNTALGKCTGDWCIYLQADEVLHENDIPALKQSLEQNLKLPEVEGLLFDYVHFYGSYDIVQFSRSAYRREVRAIKKNASPLSVGDAQGFRHISGRKLSVARTEARVFHYGWVRHPEAMRSKTFFLDQLYHGPRNDHADSGKKPHTGDNYRYKRFWGLQKFLGTHPAVMSKRISAVKWKWDYDTSKFVWTFGDIKKAILDIFEKLTGYRLFEYRNYKLIRK